MPQRCALFVRADSVPEAEDLHLALLAAMMRPLREGGQAAVTGAPLLLTTPPQ